MPHDFNAQEVQPGDRVFVPAIVQEVHATENNEYCNLTLVTEHPMPGTDNKKLTLTLYSKQTLLQAKDVGMENLSRCPGCGESDCSGTGGGSCVLYS